MPLDFSADGRRIVLADPTSVRPWNGRRLTLEETWACYRAYQITALRTDSVGLGLQAAYEWLSEHAW